MVVVQAEVIHHQLEAVVIVQDLIPLQVKAQAVAVLGEVLEVAQVEAPEVLEAHQEVVVAVVAGNY